MKILVYIDESGSIHKNSNTRFFAVGGYMVYEKDVYKVIRNYKKENLKIRKTKSMDMQNELKSRDMSTHEKLRLFNKIQDINSFCGCVKVFDKQAMVKEIVESNLFFNYSIKLLFTDCIIPIIGDAIYEQNIKFIVSVDNRNISVGRLKDLEQYLRTEFCLNNFSFRVTYYDSATNYGIQLADLIVNTFYMRDKDRSVVDEVLVQLKQKNFRISRFPGNRIVGRNVIVSNSKEDEREVIL